MAINIRTVMEIFSIFFAILIGFPLGLLGLKNKDKKFAETIKKKTLNLVEKKKFREYYSCKSGLGMGAKNFSWTAALYLDFKLNSY